MKACHESKLFAAAVVAALCMAGCVGKATFRDHVSATDARISAVEGAIEDNDRDITTLRSDTDQKIQGVEGQANSAAQVGQQALSAAEQAARGKLLWSVTLTDDQIKFPFGKAALSTDARAALDGLVEKIKSYGKALYVEVEGHTDGVGSEHYNLALGEKRALAVRDYLATRGGLPLHTMNTISMGEGEPVADNTTNEGRARNRRVVVRVLE